MADEAERNDTYYEVQVDRETLVLLGVGFLALLAAAFLVGRWTAPAGAPEPVEQAALEEQAGGGLPDEPPSEVTEDVDGEPLFGGTPVSAEGAPPIGAVPTEPLPETSEPVETPAPPKTEPPPETKPAAPASTPIPKASAEGWVVQVAAVKASKEAKALQQKLEAKGWPVRVVREGGYSKVQVGPFAKRSEADTAERRLKREERLSTWVKRS